MPYLLESTKANGLAEFKIEYINKGHRYLQFDWNFSPPQLCEGTK
jgi:hypothetical protein